MILSRSLRSALLLGCTLAPAAAYAAAPVAVSPGSEFARFFSGHTEGQGQLKIVMRKAVSVRVRGVGHTERDGTLVLEQVVNEGNKPVRTRTWRIREVAPGRFAGTLSDARGAVSAERTGGRLHIAFTGADGNGYQQWLTFAANGRSAHNTLEVHKYGMKVATLDETIRKLD